MEKATKSWLPKKISLQICPRQYHAGVTVICTHGMTFPDPGYDYTGHDATQK